MIGIDWMFLGGAGAIAGVAILEKLADDYGFPQIGLILRAVIPLIGAVAGLSLFDSMLEVFLR